MKRLPSDTTKPPDISKPADTSKPEISKPAKPADTSKPAKPADTSKPAKPPDTTNPSSSLNLEPAPKADLSLESDTRNPLDLNRR